MALEQFKQIARVLVEFGSKFDQTGVSPVSSQKSGFCAHISQKELILQCFSIYSGRWAEAVD